MSTIQGTCGFPDCKNAIHAIGLCTGHVKQHYSGRPLKALRPRVSPKKKPSECILDECHDDFYSKGFCRKHYYDYSKAAKREAKCEGEFTVDSEGDRGEATKSEVQIVSHDGGNGDGDPLPD